ERESQEPLGSVARMDQAAPRPAEPGEASRPLSVPAGGGPGPDQRVTLTLFVVEEVRVDRRGEARIVQLQAKVLAALVRAPGPCGSDLSPPHIDPVARGVLAGGA